MAQSRVFLGYGHAASSNVTLALTGQAATASAGTLGVAFGLSASGQEATASAGTLSLTNAIALAGSSGTTSAGTLLPAFGIALTGEAATGNAGTLVASVVENAIVQGGGGGGWIQFHPKEKKRKKRPTDTAGIPLTPGTAQQIADRAKQVWLSDEEAAAVAMWFFEDD